MAAFDYVGDDNANDIDNPTPGQSWDAHGFGGDDDLTGGSVNDILVGGNDDDTLHGGAGADLLDGDGAFSDPDNPDNPFKVGYYQGSDTLYGDGGNDVLAGGNGDDFLYGGADDDTLGDSYNLTEYDPATGQFIVYDVPQSEFFFGGQPSSSNDTLDGGTGNDSIVSTGGTDIIIGGDGTDSLAIFRGFSLFTPPSTTAYMIDIGDGGGGRNIGDGTTIAGIEQIAVDTGNEADTLKGGARADVLSSAGGNDTLDGRGGADTLNVGSGVDVAIGGVGSDTLIVQFTDGGAVTTRLGGSFAAGYNGAYTSASGEKVTFTGIEAFDVTGSNGADVITTGNGDDRLDGGQGADTLKGGVGNDTYVIDNLNDVVIESATTGANDTAEIFIANFDARSGGFVQIETFILGAVDSATTFIGNALNNTIYGSFGAETINGYKGADAMYGGYGDDIFVVDNVGDTVIEEVDNSDEPQNAASQGIDTVRAVVSFTLGANVENLVLGGAAVSGTGNAEINRITGNSLANILKGGGNADYLNGGAGGDTFVYSAVTDSTFTRYDRITDFSAGDKIDLRDVDANSLVSGDQNFALVDAFTNQAGQMTVSYDAANNWTEVRGDVNGDGVADFRILLLGGDKTGLLNDATIVGSYDPDIL